MSEKENIQHAQQAIAAINGRNLNAYLQLLDDSFVMETELAPGPLRGHAAVRQMLESYFQGVPDLRIEIEQIITSGDYVIVRSHLTGTHTGTFLGIPPTNNRLDVRSCNVMELRNGKAVRSKLYSETARLFQQLGVLTLPKSMAAQH
jgi:steroid delta-isomerase-like uncharacterized protein